MKVILLQSLKTLGAAGSIVEVKNGYAKNYLVPKGIAKYATKANLLSLEQEQKEISQKNQTIKEQAEQIITELGKVSIAIVRVASDDGRLYGSVTPKDIIVAIKEKLSALSITNFPIEKGNVSLGAGIKFLGTHEVKILLYNDLNLQVKVFVCRSEEEAAQSLEKGFMSTVAKAEEQDKTKQDENFIIIAKRGGRSKSRKTIKDEVAAAALESDADQHNTADPISDSNPQDNSDDIKTEGV